MASPIETGARSELTNNAQIDVSFDSGGNVGITARNIDILDQSRLIAGISNGLGTADSQAGNLRLNAAGEIQIRQSSLVENAVGSNSIGDAGNIDITTGSLSLSNRSQLNAITNGQGDAGNVIIHATDRVVFNGRSADVLSGANSRVEQSGRGRGGNIEITTGSLRLQNGAQLASGTLGRGSAGDVIIRATDRVVFDGGTALGSIGFTGSGHGGDIRVTTRSLEIYNGGQLQSSIFANGQGNAGNVIVHASDQVILDGVGSGLLTNAQDNSIGNAGNVTVTTRSLEIYNGGQLQSSIFANGQGNAGNVIVHASDQVILDGVGSGLLTNAQDNSIGNAGNVTVQSDVIELRDGAEITARGDGRGNTGSITLRSTDHIVLNNNSRILGQGVGEGTSSQPITLLTPSLSLSNNSIISTDRINRRQGASGAIRIQTSNLSLIDSSISSTALAGGQAGDIVIHGGNLRLFGHSRIRTQSNPGIGQAIDRGGNIIISANSLIAYGNSDIITAAPEGQGGDIRFGETIAFFENFDPTAANADPDTLKCNRRADVNASGAEPGIINIPDTTFIQNSLSNLPDTAVDADSLIANSCIARTANSGTFLITGSGGLPPSPGTAPLSPYPAGTVRTEPDAVPSHSWQPGDAIEEPQGVYRLPNGELVMSRECPSNQNQP